MTKLLGLGLCCVITIPSASSAQDSAAGRKASELSALIAQINAEDRGTSQDALTEYQRRRTLLPMIVKWRTSGNPNDPGASTLDRLQTELAEVDENINGAQRALQELPKVPVEMAGITIAFIPGPKVQISNPSQAQILQILSDRKIYWTDLLSRYEKRLDVLRRQMDSSNANVVVDAFGDTHPESLPRWKSREQHRLMSAQANIRQLTARIDALAAQVNVGLGTNLMLLSGLTAAQLQETLKEYGDKLKANVPASTGDPRSNAMALTMLTIAELIPRTAHQVIQQAQAEATIVLIDKQISNLAPFSDAANSKMARAIKDILTDVDQDITFINGGGDGQAVINRKTALLRDKVLPAFQAMRGLLENALIPFQQEFVGAISSDRAIIENKQDLLRNLAAEKAEREKGVQKDELDKIRERVNKVMVPSPQWK